MDQPALKGFSDDDQLDINLVRIHVRANTLAELTEPKGNRIRETAYNGQRNEHHSPDTQWPQQPEPTPYQVQLWKRYLDTTFVTNSRYLWKPVGSPDPPDITP